MSRSSALSPRQLGGGLLAALCLLSAAGCATPLEPGDQPVLLVPKEPPAGAKVDPQEAVARAAFLSQRYEDAGDAYLSLALRTPDPRLRTEFLLYSAEAALGAQDHLAAYTRTTNLLTLYPDAAFYEHAVNRQFLLARLFAQGKAIKPSWLLAVQLRDREFGIKALERFQRERERHPSADDALHYAAEAYEENDEPGLAIDTWTKLGRLYPESEWAETAEYRTGLATLRLSDGPYYDKAPMYGGLKRLEAYLKRHPRGNHAKEAADKIAELREGLAEQLFEVAEYYERKDQLYSARLYLAAIERDFPKTDAALEAKALAAQIPRTSPPPAPAPPEDLETPGGIDEDRLRIAPAPVDDFW